MAWASNGHYSAETPEYRANALHHYQANALYSAVCASGTTFAAWVATPEQRARYRRNVTTQKPVRCMVGITGECTCPQPSAESERVAA